MKPETRLHLLMAGFFSIVSVRILGSSLWPVCLINIEFTGNIVFSRLSTCLTINLFNAGADVGKERAKGSYGKQSERLLVSEETTRSLKSGFHP